MPDIGGWRHAVNDTGYCRFAEFSYASGICRVEIVQLDTPADDCPSIASYKLGQDQSAPSVVNI